MVKKETNNNVSFQSTDLTQMLGQNLPIKRTGSLDSQGDVKKARHVSGAVGSPDSQGSKTAESNKPIEKLYCDAVVNFLLKIACQVHVGAFA